MAEDFSSDLDIQCMLGRGAYGSVYKVVSRKDSETYALKILRIPQNAFDSHDVMKEVYIMMALSHPNVLKIYKPVKSKPIPGEPSTTGILVEYCAGGDLEKFIKERKGKRISSQRMLRWMKEMSSAVAYCHQKSIIHRDLKPSNIFVDHRESVKIGDFGVSRVLDCTFAGSITGTPLFMAPEVHHKRYDLKADIYSLGCIFLCLANVQCLPKHTNGNFLDLPPISVYGEIINNTIECCIKGDSPERPDAETIVRIVTEEEEERKVIPVPKKLLEVAEEFEAVKKKRSEAENRNQLLENVLKLHTIHGSNITITEDKAQRINNKTDSQGTLFSNRPLNPHEEITFEIEEISKEQYGLLTFGFTSVDPETLEGQVPESIPKLHAIKETWVVHRYEMIQAGTKVSFHYTEEGHIFSTCKGRKKYRRENLTLKPGTSVWATFNMSAQLLSVRIINILWSGSMKLESVIGHPKHEIEMTENISSTTGSDSSSQNELSQLNLTQESGDPKEGPTEEDCRVEEIHQNSETWKERLTLGKDSSSSSSTSDTEQLNDGDEVYHLLQQPPLNCTADDSSTTGRGGTRTSNLQDPDILGCNDSGSVLSRNDLSDEDDDDDQSGNVSTLPDAMDDLADSYYTCREEPAPRTGSDNDTESFEKEQEIETGDTSAINREKERQTKEMEFVTEGQVDSRRSARKVPNSHRYTICGSEDLKASTYHGSPPLSGQESVAGLGGTLQRSKSQAQIEDISESRSHFQTVKAMFEEMSRRPHQ